MSQADQRNRRARLAIQRARECAALIDDPPPGSPEAREQARQAASQLGHAHYFNTDIFDPPEQDNGA